MKLSDTNGSIGHMSDDERDADTLATWIARSIVGEDGTKGVSLDDAVTGGGYLEGTHQASLLLRGGDFWDLVAAQLVERGVLDVARHGRYTSGLKL